MGAGLFRALKNHHMSNWRPIVTGDLNAASVSGKVGIILAAAASRSLPDPSAAAIANVTLEIRSAIGFSGKYTVDQDTTALPNGLLDLAIKKIVREMTRAVDMPLSKDEETDESTYEKRLEKVRAGQWPVDPADIPLTTGQVTVGPAAQLIGSSHRRFKPWEQRGL